MDRKQNASFPLIHKSLHSPQNNCKPQSNQWNIWTGSISIATAPSRNRTVSRHYSPPPLSQTSGPEMEKDHHFHWVYLHAPALCTSTEIRHALLKCHIGSLQMWPRVGSSRDEMLGCGSDMWHRVWPPQCVHSKRNSQPSSEGVPTPLCWSFNVFDFPAENHQQQSGHRVQVVSVTGRKYAWSHDPFQPGSFVPKTHPLGYEQDRCLNVKMSNYWVTLSVHSYLLII